MDQRSVRVVVGQGDPARGALRDVLAADGFDVVGEVTAAADLAHVLAATQPDVVVLDDAIGVDAAQIVSQVAPGAKLVVIWPAGVVPIGGAVRVDPGEVAMALSATVGLAAGVELSGLGTIDRPDWIDKVRKDPSTLREKLATGGSVPVRPSVTELQRRGQRLHPSTGMGRRRNARATGDGPRPADAVLPIAAAGRIAEPDPSTAGPPVAGDEATLNRRIGMIALGGAAVAGALMIALSFGSQRQPSLIVAEPFIPPLVSNPSPADPPSTPVDPAPSGGPTTPAPPAAPTNTTTGPVTTTPGTPTGPATGPTGSGSGGPGPGTVGSGGSGSGSGSPGSGSGRPSAAAAGASASHNPHGGAPGLLRSGPVKTAASSTHANGHTPHGAHPTHPVHPHKR